MYSVPTQPLFLYNISSLCVLAEHALENNFGSVTNLLMDIILHLHIRTE